MMLNLIIEFINQTAFFFNEMAIYLVFGFLMAGVLHVIFPDSFIFRHLGKSNLSSVFKATFAGIPLPLCSCGVIPVAASIRNKGASRGASLSFLTATPQIGSDSFMITYSLIGWIFAVFRIVAAFITAILSGIFANIFTTKDDTKKVETISEDDPETMSFRLKKLLKYIQLELFGSIANYLLAGIIAAGLIATLIPDSFFQTYLNSPLLSMLIMLLAAIPMYICATASTPIAASLLLKGISPGAALVLLLAGPATNAVTISTVVKTMGKRALAIYLGSISVVSLLLGALLNYLALEMNVSVISHQHHEILPTWLEYTGSALLLLMLAGHYIPKLFKKKAGTQDRAFMSGIKTIAVSGMNCNHCTETVRKAVDSVPGTSDVQVDLSSGKVSFKLESDDIVTVEKAIREKGYEVSVT